MALQIGSGEAILNTPFSFLVRRGLRRLAAGMRAGRSEVLSVRMPLNRRMFVWASGRYWTDYGAKTTSPPERCGPWRSREARDFQP